ncbi:MAG: 30S ribosome-binding factor RbfA [Planctomycetota bacterium]|jgi:ribosome-binding factor A
MTQRTDQVASVIQRAVQEILSRGLNDPRVRGLLSVTKVEVSDDLAQAWISVSVLPQEHARRTLQGLEHASHYIQGKVGRAVRLRRTPHLMFRLDESIKREAQVYAAIARARRTDESQPGRAEAPTTEELDS